MKLQKHPKTSEEAEELDAWKIRTPVTPSKKSTPAAPLPVHTLNLLVSERAQPAGWFTDSGTREWNRKGRVEGEQDVEKRGKTQRKG